METIEGQETEADRLTWEVRTMSEQLRDLTKDIVNLQKRARDGDLSVAKEAQTTVREVRTFLTRVAETEAKLAEYRRGEGGGGGQHALDLDGARASIRCKLDRLRRCQCPG